MKFGEKADYKEGDLVLLKGERRFGVLEVSRRAVVPSNGNVYFYLTDGSVVFTTTARRMKPAPVGVKRGDLNADD